MLNPKDWVSNYGDYLLSIALMKTNNPAVAEDLVQDTFLSAIKALESFKGESTEKMWLVRILQNKIIDYYRKKDILKGTVDYLQNTANSFDELFMLIITHRHIGNRIPHLILGNQPLILTFTRLNSIKFWGYA